MRTVGARKSVGSPVSPGASSSGGRSSLAYNRYSEGANATSVPRKHSMLR